MRCFAPSELVVRDVYQPFGDAAEAIIRPYYLRNVGRFAFYPHSLKDFNDADRGVDRRGLFINYLRENNPHLGTGYRLGAMALEKDLVKIPDFVTHDPPRRTEFYEIKPNSASGRGAGDEKIAWFDGLCHHLRLPYKPGVQFSPNERVRLWSGQMFGMSFDVDLHFFRNAPVLILYEVCVGGKLVEVAEYLVEFALTLVLLLILRRLAPKGPMSIPEPMPVPVI